jgi:hypothetical protein
MTPSDFIAQFRAHFASGPIDPVEALHFANVLFVEISAAVYEATLSNGERAFVDPVNARRWFMEAIVAVHDSTTSHRMRIEPRHEPRRVDRTCPDCGHVHLEESECAVSIGGARTCRCERKVRA